MTNKKSKNNPYIFLFISLIVTLAAFIFKTSHWPWGNTLLYTGSVMLGLSILYYLFKRIKHKQYKLQPLLDLTATLPLLYFVLFMVLKFLFSISIPFSHLLSPVYFLIVWSLVLLIEVFFIKQARTGKCLSIVAMILVIYSSFNFSTRMSDKENMVPKAIASAFITTTEQSLNQNARLIESIDGISKKLKYLKDEFPQVTKQATKTTLMLEKINSYANKADDFIESELNFMINKAEGEARWFKKDTNQQILYYDFNELVFIKNYDIPTALFGLPEGRSFNRGNKLRLKLTELRDSLILTLFNSQENLTDSLAASDLSSFTNLELTLVLYNSELEKDILDIYTMLTKPEYINTYNGENKPWNVGRFYHQTVIGAIGTFTSLRNDIRLAQQKASKILMKRIDVPIY